MPKVLLIQPTQYGSTTGTLLKQKRIYLPGLGLPLLAAMVPKHWEVEILIEVIEDVDFESDAELVGIGGMGHAIFRGIELADEFRRRGKTVFMGGYMASLMPDFVSAHCDGIVVGDGEVAFPELIKDFETTGRIKPVYDRQLDSLEGMPMPRYDLLVKKPIGFMMPVQAGRGCPHTCSYCSIACIYHGKYLFRPVEEVIRDIKEVKRLGYRRFFLIDDNIAGNPGYLKELASAIKPLKMVWASQCSIRVAHDHELLRHIRQAGCRMLSLGIESISQEGLDKLNKGWMKTADTAMLLRRIQKAGILPATEMIVGTDGDTVESLQETYRFVMDGGIPVPKYYVLTPLPGTEFHRTMEEEGRLLHKEYIKYTATSCVFKPKNMSPEELEREFWELYRKTYSIRSILRRTLFNRDFFRNPLIYLFAFFTNLMYIRYIRQGDAPNIL